ncbi:ribonuclease H-like domain-containing protein [Tanacetum coccineum]
MKRGNYDSHLCKNCGLKGHIVDMCFEIIRYPHGLKRNPNLKPTSNFNNNKSNNVDAKGRSMGNNESKTGSTLSFTNEQVMKLMSLFNEKTYSTAQANMVGVNQHITNSTKNMIDLVDISELKLIVGHPNGTLPKITHVGNLKLNNDVILFDVLVVPEYCGRVLGTSSEFGGLYLFDKEYNMSASVNQKGSIRQPVVESDLDHSGSDVYLHQPGFDDITVQPGYGELHNATPLGDNIQSEGNEVPSLDVSVPIFQNIPETQIEESSLRRSKRSSKLPAKLNDFVLDNKVKYGLNRYANHCVLNAENCCFMSNLDKSSGPSFFEEASKAINCYVDDLVLTGNSEVEIKEFKKFLSYKFKIKDLGELKYFLGIEVLKTKIGLCLNQRKYCLEVLHEFDLLACRPVVTPLSENIILADKESDDDKYLKNITSYMKLVGKLIYLTMTRPDISYDVHCLSQHMHAPLQSHFNIVLRVLKLGKVSYDKKILKVIKDLNLDNLVLVTLFCDNKSAIQIAANPVMHEKTKHFDIDVHLVRAKVTSGLIKTEKVDSKGQIATILTKALGSAQHIVLTKRLGLNVLGGGNDGSNVVVWDKVVMGQNGGGI